MDILKNIGRRKRTLMNSPLKYQAMLDNAPVGSVGAPGGVLPNAKRAEYRDPAESLLRGLSLAPVVGDIAGPLADIRRFQNDPESRTLGNAAMFALGTLPAIPSLAFLMSQGGNAARRVTPFSKESGIIGYHGSPHKFDAFDMSKIGTGEGAQAYGHGLYFAESSDVAKGYRDELAGKVSIQKLRELQNSNAGDAPLNAAKDMFSRGYSEDEVSSVLQQAYPELKPELSKVAIEAARPGSLYTVDIPDEHIDKMLDWDKPLSEQPEAVRQAVLGDIGQAIQQTRAALSSASERRAPTTAAELEKLLKEKARLEGMTGEALYRQLSLGEARHAPQASQNLQALGIPGIKYLDAGSRGAGSGTRNFVLFDDKIPKILKRE